MYRYIGTLVSGIQREAKSEYRKTNHILPNNYLFITIYKIQLRISSNKDKVT